jgi:hypothetical protein
MDLVGLFFRRPIVKHKQLVEYRYGQVKAQLPSENYLIEYASEP